jgi:glycosyltransferase involved in cell wall biosynthesis
MFTIIIATHDRPMLLGRALRSLIDQTYQDFQVIIIADESKYIPPYNELLLLAGRYIYVLRSGTPGPAESRNVGLALVKTDYTLFLDDDDTFEPGHLAGLAKAIGTLRPEIAYCDFQVIDEDRNLSPPQILKTYPINLGLIDVKSLYVKNTIPNCALVFSSSLIASLRFDPTLIIYEDWDFLLHATRRAPLTHVEINSVFIHKSWAEGAANQRRGAGSNDKVVEQTLQIYKRHPAPDDIRLARQKFFVGAGLNLPIEEF